MKKMTIELKEKLMAFAEELAYVRQKLLLSRSEMAKEMNVTEQTIYRWEQGLSIPHISSQRKFIDFCKKKRVNTENLLQINK